MQVLEAPAATRVHLTTFRDLERHCRDAAKQAGYERLLRDFGIDVARFSRLVEHPRLVLAEQPGCWFCGGDVMRYRLLRLLLETAPFHPGSGVLSLASDAFTCRGVKKLFLVLNLHPRLRPVYLLGAPYVRRYRNRVYHALPIAGSACQRIAAILDVCDRMLSSAGTSPAVFAEEVTAIFRAGVRPGLRPLLPARVDRGSLRELGAHLADYDLAAARRPLAAARRELGDGVSWVRYWNRVNSSFLDTEIGRLGPLLNRFLLAVDDPVRMSRNLMRLTGHPLGEPIAVAAIVANDDKYRMVFFDPADSRFFYLPRAGQRRDVAWARVRALAAAGRSGGPSGTLEYLLMAASGIYLVADPGDGFNRFERQARAIHEHYTGLPFPYVALATNGGKPPTDYLSIYAPGFEDTLRQAVERFFE